MNSKILITGLPLSENSKNEISHLLEKLLRHHGVIRVRLDLHESALHDGKTCHTVKGVVERPGPDLVASESANNLYKAVHLLTDKLERGLTEHTRLTNEKRRHPHPTDLPAPLPKTV